MAAVLPVERPLRERPYARQQAMLALVVLLFGAIVAGVAEQYLNGYRQQLVILCAIYAIVAVALALTSEGEPEMSSCHCQSTRRGFLVGCSAAVASIAAA